MTDPVQRRSRRVERGWNQDSSPFHPGEQQVQSRVGVRAQIERAGRNMIHEQLPDQHRALFEALPLLVVGSSDAQGRLWASLLAGEPGFIHSPSPKLLQIHAQPALGDPLDQNLKLGAPLGLLGIQLQTRRRSRANGRVVARDRTSFSVEVAQSFGNCDQYIQAREPVFDRTLLGRAGPFHTEGTHSEGTHTEGLHTEGLHTEGPYLSAASRGLLERTDTFFIATASASPSATTAGEGVDVSHRGGRPGFVRATDGPSGTQLTVPDFRGNFIFNTFGNLEVNPRAGIVCADFSSGNILSLTGTARVIWDGPELAAFKGADRLLHFDVESALYLEHALPLQFHGLSPSPDLLETGTWADAATR